MSRHWEWSTNDADWSVMFDEQAGVLRWRGVDKPRPGVPAYAQGGGEVDQKTWDLLTTGRAAYECPPEILVDVIRAARAALPSSGGTPTRVRVPSLADASIDRVLRICQVAVQMLTRANGLLAGSVRQLLAEEVPDDRPTQTSATRYITGVWIGDRTFFQCTEEVGGGSQGSSDWLTVDFAGSGRLWMELDNAGVTIEGAAPAVDAVANAILMNTSPDDDDLAVHERAAAVVRSRFVGTPGVVWEVKAEMCREGVLVAGRASSVAYDVYLALLPPERFFILHVVEVEQD
jgi:hypothetical protein